MMWKLLHKLVCPVDVSLVNLAKMCPVAYWMFWRVVLLCHFSRCLYIPPPPARAPQNAAQLLNILSKTIFQNHLIR